jgi:iron complex outermembrane receptor protein
MKSYLLGVVLLAAPAANAQDPNETLKLNTIRVEADSIETYIPSEAVTATKTDTPLRDIPQVVHVITAAELKDRGVTNITEAFRTVPGVQGGTGYGGLANGYGTFMRGFFSATNYRDGFRDFSFVSPRDIAVFEQIEVLKGPASVLYGSNEPGGVINFVSKRPQLESAYEFNASVGSYHQRRVEADATGAVGDSEQFSYRIVAAYDEGDSHRDYVNHEQVVIAPSFAWQVSDSTEATLLLEYVKRDYMFERGFSSNEELLDLPRDRFLEEPDYNFAETKSHRAVLEITHQFNDDWSLRAGSSYIKPEIEKLNFYPFGLESDGRTFTRSPDYSKEYQKDQAVQIELVGKFNALGVSHTLLSGVEHYRDNFHYTFAPFDQSDSIDVYNPVYGDYEFPAGFFDMVAFGNDYGSRTKAIYVQDQITISKQWKALVGFRYDRNNLFSDDLVDPAFSLREQTQSRTSPRAGVVYQPSELTSFYLSYTTSFNPQLFSPLENGDLPVPEVGQQYEIGWKQDWLDGAINSTVAAFDITKENVTTTVPGTQFARQVGEQGSRGVEVEVRGTIAGRVNAILTGAYLDAETTRDGEIPEGDRLRAAPEFQTSAWLMYEGNNWFGGGGVYHMTERETDDTNADGIQLPAETMVDAVVGYRARSWRLQLDLKNLLDEENYLQSGFFIPGPGRNVKLTLRYTL